MRSPNGFMFATGIECSNPVAVDSHGRRARIDELALTFHYTHWKHDLQLVRDVGLDYLRYGPPWYRVHLAPGRYDWEFTDAVFAEMRRLRIEPIVDLCHFGVPDWIGDFQNPDWPQLFADYALAFAARFPWVRLYTPVNEIYVCAKLSTLVGFWNERARGDHRAFVTAVKHLCKANLLAIGRILTLRPDAMFIQSESAEYFHLGGGDPASIASARWENELRFLSLDLLFSHQPVADVVSYLFDNGLTRSEYDWFMTHGLDGRIVMGNDYYDRNEQVIGRHGARPTGEVFGWAVITQQYYERYRRPVMHTETNTFNAADAPRWLWKEFYNVRYLREQGVPVIGFTWYSLLDQVDWDSALVRERGVVNAVGLFDLQRRARPVAAAYRKVLEEFGSEPFLPEGYRLDDDTNAPFGAGASWSRLSSVR
jgi:beta-glucosidase/6-phospho-beta-glucosidase/beta-galactosidase